MIEFVFMLTHHDRTVDNPTGVYEQIRGCGLRYVGFKDIGAGVKELQEVCARAHADGLEVMLEVVSTTKEDELRSVAASAEIGVDWLLGGTHPEDGLRVLNGSTGVKYCPFPGVVVGHPSILQGDIAEIAESGRLITELDGVYGLDLLAYRHQTADAAELTRAVVRAATGPVIAAGSVASVAQIRALDKAGAWGFTIGGAIFEGQLPGGPSIAGQVPRGAPRRGGPGNHVTSPGIILAVDQGSSSSRCVALDRALRPVAQASRPVASSFPRPGWVEHDPAELLDSVLGAIADATGQAGVSWADIAGIGLAAQTETFVVWDRASGKPVYPAVSWRDSRAGEPLRRTPPDRPRGRDPAAHGTAGGSSVQCFKTVLAAQRRAGRPPPGRRRGSAVRRRELLADVAPQRRRCACHRAVHGRADHAVQPGHVGLGP